MRFEELKPGMKLSIPAIGTMPARNVECIAVGIKDATFANLDTGRRSTVGQRVWDTQQRYHRFARLLQTVQPPKTDADLAQRLAQVEQSLHLFGALFSKLMTPEILAQFGKKV